VSLIISAVHEPLYICNPEGHPDGLGIPEI
jgi:hypothetical protein